MFDVSKSFFFFGEKENIKIGGHEDVRNRDHTKVLFYGKIQMLQSP